jgi:hypothetical protein
MYRFTAMYASIRHFYFYFLSLTLFLYLLMYRFTVPYASNTDLCYDFILTRVRLEKTS